jgi:hypothetical protein
LKGQPPCSELTAVEPSLTTQKKFRAVGARSAQLIELDILANTARRFHEGANL